MSEPVAAFAAFVAAYALVALALFATTSNADVERRRPTPTSNADVQR